MIKARLKDIGGQYVITAPNDSYGCIDILDIPEDVTTKTIQRIVDNYVLQFGMIDSSITEIDYHTIKFLS